MFKLFFLTICIISSRQDETATIDQQVWRPFIQAYSNWDAEMFNNTHSDEMIRINSKEILPAKMYKEQVSNWFEKAKKEGYQQSISLRFEKRIVTGNKTFESGYYEIRITKPEGTRSDYYARFHMLLQKENGIWKIIQDWSSSSLNGTAVTVHDFQKLDPFKPSE